VRTLTSAAFLGLHSVGGLYVLGTLVLAWKLRLLLQLLAQRVPLVNLLPLAWLFVPAALGLIAILAVVESVRTARRWRQRLPDPDLGVRMRALVYAGVGCVAVNALILSTPVSFSGPFRLKFLIHAYISVAFAYGAYVLWSVSLPWWRRRLSPRARRGIDLLGMNVVITLILGEIALRVVATFWPSPLLITSATPSQVRRGAERQPPGALRFGFPMNQGGHYDTEFVPRTASSNRVVITIGDSFSYGIVPHAYHYTTVAERELRGIEVYNMGYPGTSPSDYLYLLEHDALPLEPDLVVIAVFMGNDVNESPEPAGQARWHDGDSYLLAVVWHRLRLMKRAELARAPTASAANLTPDELAVEYPWLRDPLLETPHLGEEVFMQLETRNAELICVPAPGVYERFLSTLSALKQAAGTVPLAFMLIPDELQVEDDVWEAVARRSGRPLDRDLAQRTTVGWLSARGWPVLDLLPLLRAVEPLQDGRRHVYHRRNTHFNARGNAVAGRALARFADSLLANPPVAGRVAAGPPPPDVTLPLHLSFGDTAMRQWVWGGWYPSETAGGGTFAWSDGLRSALSVPLPAGGDIAMEFEALPFTFRRSPPQRVTVVLNGTVIDTVELTKGVRSYSVILPAAALGASPDLLEFRYAYARAPREVRWRTRDIRQLAVAWYGIDFRALAPATPESR
jgi:hypothetical protein